MAAGTVYTAPAPAPPTAGEAVGQVISFHKPPLYVEQVTTYPNQPRLLDVRLPAPPLCAMSIPERRAALEQTVRPVLAAARARHVRVRVSRISSSGDIRYVWAVSSGGAIRLTSVGRARGRSVRSMSIRAVPVTLAGRARAVPGKGPR